MKPDIYYFNPTCELAVANGSTNYMASKRLCRFEQEMSTLPGILGKSGDLVLVDRQPPKEHIHQLQEYGFHLPDFEILENSLIDPDFLASSKGFLFPWGWSPAAHKLLSPIKRGCCSEFQGSAIANWREIHKDLYSRKASLDILKQIVISQDSNKLLSINDLPEICWNHEEIMGLQKRWGRVVVKAPWSASGRGLQILRPDEYNQTNRQVIAGIFKQQGYVVVEPWHQKQIDLSFQFFSLGNGKVEFKGLSSFTTDKSGHFLGNNIQELPAELNSDIADFLSENLEMLKSTLHQILILNDYSSRYYGWFGVDVMVIKSRAGGLLFHPCVEINCRFTMGAIALNLREHLHDGSLGEFRIFYGNEGDFSGYCREMTKKEPVIIENGKIVQGFLQLTPLQSDSIFGAYMRISLKGGNFI